MDAIELIEAFLRKIFEEEKIKSFEEKLRVNESKMKNLKEFLLWSTLESLFLISTAIIICFSIWEKNYSMLFLIALISFLLPFAFNFLFQDLKFEKRKRIKEDALSDLLLEASVFCDESSAEKSIKKIAEQDFGLISKDFSNAYIEIKNGASIEEALMHLSRINKSKQYSRVLGLIIQGYKNGTPMSEIFKETAEDLLETKAILKERQAVMLVTKYTLILSSALIIPAVLGLIVGLVSGLNFSSMGELSLGIDAEQRKELFEHAIIGTTFYIFEYALLSAYFLSLQQGNKKNFWVYAGILVPVAGIVFFAARAG